jgi:succinate-semialdehyde dehydrogenase/glutarate-semialdehyde dehydrogenase
MLGINTGMISTEGVPFGRIKESSIGRYGSPQDIDEYLEVKYVCLGGIDR